MNFSILLFILTVVEMIFSSPIDESDLFFGTEAGGNVFPGATRPFGMVKMGIDVIGSALGDAYSGYAPDGKVVGISMMHESGTGGLPQYGVVSQMPYVGTIDFSKQAFIERSAKDEARPGYYKLVFKNNVTLEMVAADRAGIYSYEFPKDVNPQIIVNGSHHLVSSGRPYWTQNFVNGSIIAENDLTLYTGETTIEGGWGYERPWTIYYCGEFDVTPNNITSFNDTHSEVGSHQTNTTKENGSMGLVFAFPQGTTKIRSRVGISHVSVDQACANIHTELDKISSIEQLEKSTDTLNEAVFNNSFNIDEVEKTSRNIWNSEVFDKVSIQTDNATVSQMIYSALYGSHLLPTNKTGEHPFWQTSEPYYDDFFTLWDTFRCLNPLFHALSPSRSAEIIRSLILVYENDGYLPDGRAANQNGKTQGGSNADIVLADAFVKNITQGIDWSQGYAAMVKNAEVEPPYFYDRFATDASTLQGRGGLSDWLKYGWITRNYTRSVTRTVEYSYNDYALSVVAVGLGNSTDLLKYLKRSANWQNLWNFNANFSEFSYTGFIQPKDENGTFYTKDYNPLKCGDCYWGDDEYEGTPIEYGWAVPHDFETLKNFIGSKDTFIKRLDDMFPLKGRNIAQIGNEPSFLTPYLYNYVNEQWRTVEIMRYLINNKYSTGAKGLPGNADAGAMQSYLFWGLIGVYPVSGTTTYLLSSPWVNETTLNLENGSQLVIKATDLSSSNVYVQSVLVNGKNWTQNWVSHEDIFTNGGTIEFQMGATAVVWETGDVPPSAGHYSLIRPDL